MENIMSIKLAASVAPFVIFGLGVAAQANPPLVPAAGDPLAAVLLVVPPGFADGAPFGPDPRQIEIISMTVPDITTILEMVLPEPVGPWDPGRPPPTLDDVVSVISFADWVPVDPHNPQGGWGNVGGAFSQASAAWQAQMAAYQAQVAETNAQRMEDFSAGIRSQFDTAMSPDFNPFEDLMVNELVVEDGFALSDLDWNRSGGRNVGRVVPSFRTTQPGFFGQ